ncbi:MAG: 5'-3' exonuclease [Solirubrobacteraceae bacterium]
MGGLAACGPLLVVDGPLLLYRSFFGVPDTVRDAAGQPRNALLGSVNLLLRAVAETGPRAVVVCFGAQDAPYRVALYSGYHATRPPMPEALSRQFDRAPELFASFGWRVESSADLEADDLLGSLARVEEQAGGSTLILTGDRDMYQCVTERTQVLYLSRGSAGFQRLGPEEVRHRYGVSPDQVPDFIALRGDPSDGLPGAPGIGQKTAADLLCRHGTLERVLEAACAVDGGAERPRIAAALRRNAGTLRSFRAIAQLQTVAVTRPADRVTDRVGGAAAARTLGMNALADRLDRHVAGV